MISLKNLEVASLQDVFNQGARHLLSQNAKAKSSRGCMYYIDGRKCAGGCFISPQEYNTVLEGVPFLKVAEDFGLNSKNYNVKLVSELQLVHDLSDVEDWIPKLVEVAERFDISHEVLKEFYEPT